MLEGSERERVPTQLARQADGDAGVAGLHVRSVHVDAVALVPNWPARHSRDAQGERVARSFDA